MMLRLLIALLLFAAAPPVLAQVSLPARDMLLEQLQAQTKEAQARTEEAERREREAEINRLTEQARQEKFRADAAEQLMSAGQRELYIQEAKGALDNSAYARLEIITSVSIGFFGILITIIVLFITLRTEKAAVASAIDAGKRGIEEIQERAKEAVAEIEKKRQESDAHLIRMRENTTKSDEMRQAYEQSYASLPPSFSYEVPKSESDRKTIADAARDAHLKPPRDRTANDFRAIIIDAFTEQKWSEMLTTSQQMRLLHEGDDDFGYSRMQEAYALGQLGRPYEEISLYEEVIQRYEVGDLPTTREYVARSLFNKGVRFAELGRVEEAIAAYDKMIALYGADSAIGMHRLLAKALINKGAESGKLGHSDLALASYDDVIVRFSASGEPGLQEAVAQAFTNKGVRLGEMGRREEEIAAYDKVIERLGASDVPGHLEHVARALVYRGVTLIELGRNKEAFADFEAVIDRYGAATTSALREQVANALVSKGVLLGQLGRSEEAIAVYDNVVARFGAAPEAALREQVARALFNTACVYAQNGSVADAIKALQAMIKAGRPLDLKEIAEDTDFDSIRNDPAFIKFLKENGAA